ncbi:bifunctional tetrahydrofolate synthase/dihydrofolate synthase [Nitrosomonas sp. Nm166]|uniref:bifunctional tetrahydrofolate synthase/dihydrofolate synthase n=1 Tax=Nitrosomonas sp. Nm166 TaxID=1881054 RepID=UPI0008F14E96|nr:bifunctional tetrahydrofolate synthase/dihydrofolate synthase [Nitrosomonas sp. Nm166]SFF06237.1 dihydrofolate synthase / folylpolyglutamate synthase [Nitrosomonas sp. Nm166]
MNAPKTGSGSLADWLIYLEALHPKTIEMGLDRVNKVKLKLGLAPSFPVIIVGGTNGKGSVCAMLESILFCTGYKVGCYTSPHLLHYNERIRINKKEIDDETLCQIFEQINTARKDCQTSLTFFEFGTLAAMCIFIKAQIDVAILEVGLGGRLDAVNVFDADCSIVTSIDLDHIEYLGDTREKIGFEKAAIFRKNKPAICSETELPDSVNQQVKSIGANFFQYTKEFGFSKKNGQWDFWGPKGWRYSLPLPALRGEKQLQNASTCLAALDILNEVLPVSMNDVRLGLLEAVIPARFQVISTQPMIILDVAHNPSAASVLSGNLAATKPIGKTYGIFAMLKDKDIAGVVKALRNDIDCWLVSTVHSARTATVDYLINEIHNAGVVNEKNIVYQFSDCAAALVFACEQATKNDRICVFGSFYTVSDVLRHLNTL